MYNQTVLHRDLSPRVGDDIPPCSPHPAAPSAVHLGSSPLPSLSEEQVVQCHLREQLGPECLCVQGVGSGEEGAGLACRELVICP